MKFNEAWLREWVNPSISHEALLEQITLAGLEVDSEVAVAGEFSGVVVGQVIECKPHPDADKLRVTKVDVGAETLLNIVCGAANCRQGLKVVCAVVGAELPNNFKIKSAKLRGIPSEGMLCSYSELGISDDHSGIIELPDDAPIGKDFRDYYQLNDTTVEISLTPNRADCLGIIGIARDVAVLNGLKFTVNDIKPTLVTHSEIFPVSVEDPQSCPRYLARVIKNINVAAPTPIWMKEKLRRCGVRSIDIIVDITNYVLLELGHPMHAFDFEKLSGGIVVRQAKENESLTLLDGNTVKILPNTLVIADHQKVVALAGIFGGKETGVTEKTQHILLESAYFSPLAIAGKAREYGLHTDASHRYERGVDPQLQYRAMERASELIVSLCGGDVAPIVEVNEEHYLPEKKEISLSRDKVDRLIGYVIDDEKITSILSLLGCQVVKQNNHWQVTPPSWRFDLEIEEDLVEEIARVYGYNNIPMQALHCDLSMLPHQESQLSLKRAKELLIDCGYYEAITYSFVDPKIQTLLHPQQPALVLPNPISSDMSAMRLSLWSGLIATALYNQNRQQSRVRLFESGLRFIPDQTAEFGMRQERVLSGLVMGSLGEEHWKLKNRTIDFFDLKGDVEALLSLTNCANEVIFKPTNHSALHPGQSAEIYFKDQLVGYIGVIHPMLEKKLGLFSKVIVFELEWDKVSNARIPMAKEISKYPANSRDIAIVVKDSVAAADVLAVCKEVAKNQLVDVNLFDVYKGSGIEGGYKSLAINLVLQDEGRTLEEAQITDIVNQCLFKLKKCFQATLRE